MMSLPSGDIAKLSNNLSVNDIKYLLKAGMSVNDIKKKMSYNRQPVAYAEGDGALNQGTINLNGGTNFNSVTSMEGLISAGWTMSTD